MDVLGRYRNLIVLVGVLFAQVLGLAVQVRRTTDNEPTRLIRIWAVGAITPLEKTLNWVQTASGGIWHNYFYLRGVRAENRELKQEIEQMRLEQARISQDADQARRLQALLGFKEQFISQTMAAQVIGSSGSELSRAVYLDKGEKNGIKPDMAVITKDGIVGKVLRVYRSTALVLLIDDQTSGVGSILDKSRLQGILRGTSSGDVVLEKVMSDETVPVGEQVLTSGGDGIFPKGLAVGTVTQVSMGSDLFLNIHVRPSADLNRLEEVLVITKVDERQTEPDKAAPVRAADILAERLPTVPPKPEIPAGAAAKSSAMPTNGVAKPGAVTNPPAAPSGTVPSKASIGAATPGISVTKPSIAVNSSAAKSVASATPNSGTAKPATGTSLNPAATKPTTGATPNSAATKSASGAASYPAATKPVSNAMQNPAATKPPTAAATNPAAAKTGTTNPTAPVVKKATPPNATAANPTAGTTPPAGAPKKPAVKPTSITGPGIAPKAQPAPQDPPQ